MGVPPGSATPIQILDVPLEDNFQRELDLPLRHARPNDLSPNGVHRPIPLEDVRAIGSDGRTKIGMIENVENLGAELDVECLRESLDVVILEHREVQVLYARTDQDVPPSITPKIKTPEIVRISRDGTAERGIATDPLRRSVAVEKAHVRSLRNSKA